MKNSKELMKEAMSMGIPDRVPVMCQMAIGHTLMKSKLDSIDFFLSSETYAAGLLAIRNPGILVSVY